MTEPFSERFRAPLQFGSGNSGERPLLSVVVPCFNEEAVSQFRFPDTASDYVKWIDESYGWDPDRAIAHSSEYEKVPNFCCEKDIVWSRNSSRDRKARCPTHLRTLRMSGFCHHPNV